MKDQPTLQTRRLTLRPFTSADAPHVQAMAGDFRVAEMAANIPHPYLDGIAEEWIAGHPAQWARGEMAAFAITRTDGGELVGCISLMNMADGEAEVGYWIGVDYWNQGFGTEACAAVLQFGFDALHLRRLHAHHLSRNPASGRVLSRAGMVHIGGGISTGGLRSEGEPIECYEVLRG